MYLKVSVAVLSLVSSALANGVTPAQCPANEIYKTCGACDAGCKEPKPICPKDECREGCFCIDHYVRDNDSKCIPRDHCPRACQDGEVFKTCGTCDKQCENRNPICTEECKVGCFCIDGYYRNNAGQCVPLDKCCKPGEVYTTCGGCEPGCTKTDIACAAVCREGCACMKGYVRENGTCIPREHCPQQCKDGEIFKTCGTCDKLCKNPNPFCTKECKVGCFCIDGYYRNDAGQCVPLDRCPRTCKPGEVYSECGGCDGTCDRPSVPCARICRVGCFCMKGYVRNSAGECIPLDKCPRKCNSNEYYTECGGCDGTCDNRNPACTLQCHIGCFCIKGHVRNSAGRCIPVGQCPRRCKCDEVWKDCGTCDRTCKNPHPICPQVCRPGCYCRDGLLRNNRGRCVQQKNCCT